MALQNAIDSFDFLEIPYISHFLLPVFVSFSTIYCIFAAEIN